MKKVLFITAHRPNRSPSQRFRIECFFDFLNQNGYECNLAYLLNAEQDVCFYQKASTPKHYFLKAQVLLQAAFKRLVHVLRANQYQLIFIHREAFFLGNAWFEKLLKAITTVPIIFDFDDAIWLPNVSEGNRRFAFLKNGNKIPEIIKRSNLVIAGNTFLQEYALQFNANTVVMPSVIDTNVYKPIENKQNKEQVCIGWSGSPTTVLNLTPLLPVFQKIKERYGEKVCFKVLGDPNFEDKALDIQGVEWTPQNEVPFINTFDIGIMPLLHHNWARGKCGMKGLQYMALEKATVMENFGANIDIISEYYNGLLANTPNEWFEKLCLCVENEALRAEMGKNARQTVLQRYSVVSQQTPLLNYFNELTK